MEKKSSHEWICADCGKPNDPEARTCPACGCALPLDSAESPAFHGYLVEAASKDLIDLDRIRGALCEDAGFTHPVWEHIGEFIQANASAAEHATAWQEAAQQWIEHLREDMGGGYRIYRLDGILMLTDLPSDSANGLLEFSSRAVSQLGGLLGDAAWRSGFGDHVILLFSDEDDYYGYISHFYPEGEHPTSTGVCVGRGYVHIAVHAEEHTPLRRVLAHELTHNLISHLPAPSWLHEALAQTVESSLGVTGAFHLGSEQLDEHLAYWTSDNLQEFWAGISFHEPGDVQRLSYELSLILFQLLREKQADWTGFLLHVEWEDAGQNAALQFLGTDLGETLGQFLGPGDWRPRRKTIKGLWEQKKKEDVSDSNGPSDNSA